MLLEKKRIEEKIHAVQEQISTCPEGKIIHAKNGKGCKWYLSDGSKHSYIKKNEQELIRKLSIKKYLTLLQEEYIAEKNAIDAYLKYHNSKQRKADQLLEDTSPYKQYLSSYFSVDSKELNIWMNLPYESNPACPEQLIHKTITGKYVRSKSEALITMILYKYKVPFRYECALQLGESFVYPDFMIRHPKTGEVFYWEHFGMMDNPEYAEKTYSKLWKYHQHGLLQSINLITTFETKQNPLSMQTIEETIQHYFL